MKVGWIVTKKNKIGDEHMVANGEKLIVKVTWKSEDGFQFMGMAANKNCDIVSTTAKAVAQMDVGSYVWCEQETNEEWGIHMKEIPFQPFATKEEWEIQEETYNR